MSARPDPAVLPRASLLPLGLVALLAAVAGAGFAAVFPGWGFVWVPVLGALTGAGVSFAAARYRLLVGETLALSVLAMLVVGALAVGGGTPSGAVAFVRGLVTGWAELLTSFTPVPTSPSLLALPFVLSWFGALVGGELRRVTRVPGLPAIGPLLAFAASLLFTIEFRPLALAQGVVMGVGTLALALVQQREQRTLEDDLTTGSTHRWTLRGMTSAATLLVIVVLAAPLLGPNLPLADANERFDLRRYLVPPFDPLAIPSPLTTIKGELRDQTREDVAFIVTSPDRPTRWPVAVMGAYDGVVWTVAESASSDAGRYPQIDAAVPPPPDGDLDLDRPEVRADVEVVDLRGHWVPRPGWVTSLAMPADTDVRFNPVTGNLALPGQLRPGLTFEVAGVPMPEAGELSGAPLTGDASGFATLQPAIRNLVADLVQGQDGGWPQVLAVADWMRDTGFYDVSPGARPGHSFFRLGEFLADPERVIGFEEQYAAAAGVAVRSLEQPVRVVAGYVIPDERWEGDTAEVRREDVSAWIEVRTVDGWAALDVTPDRSREPEAEEQGRTVEDVALPNPPPPPPPPPDEEPTDREELDDDLDIEEDDEEELVAGLPPIVWYAAAGVGVPALLLTALAVAIASVRARRRVRRRRAPQPALRVAGAWQEVLDRCRELGRHRDPVDTTRETARRLVTGSSVDADRLLVLADRVDHAAFAPQPPSDADVQAAWSVADEFSAALLAEAHWTQRLRLRFDPRPMLRRDPLRAAGHDSITEVPT